MKQKQELMVSIRCITYNHEPYIRQCLEGFVMQKTNFKFEAVVHDDASTDGTAAIIREYAEKYPDIIKPLYETENQYSKHDGSLQRIMEAHMCGKYVAICEGDDYWTDPLKLQKQVEILEKDETIIGVYTNVSQVDKCGNVLKSSILSFTESFVLDMDRFCLGDYNYIPTLSMVFRTTKNPLREQRLEIMKNRFMGDWILWIALLQEGNLYYLNEVTGAYRINPTSVTHTVNRVERAKAHMPILENVRKVVPDKYRKYFTTKGWAYFDIALAYKSGKQYIPMSWYLLRSFIDDPKFFISKIRKLLKF